MKITYIISLFIFLYLHFGVLDAHAQQFRELQPLDVHNFECLKSLECAQNSQSLKSKGWSFVFDETVDEFAPELTAQMKGENISFFAIYDSKGYLIRSTYKREDVALPNRLLAYLTAGDYKGWQITRTEMVVKDFDPATVNYKVMLKNNTLAKSEVFDSKFINDLHLKNEGLVKQLPL